VAQRLKQRILEETRLTASAGVAPNKFLAKIASGWQKPDGLTVISPKRVEAFLQQLPVDALWGVGPVTAAKLRKIGIARLVEVRGADPRLLQRAVGSMAGMLQRLAWGEDARPVVPNRPYKSSSSENTYNEDLLDLDAIRAEIERMARKAADWLARKALLARTVTIKVRYAGFTTVTRSHSSALATRDADEIAARALALLARTEAGRKPIRLLGAGVHGLVEGDAALGATGVLGFDD
jgi:DNA polymerase-4